MAVEAPAAPAAPAANPGSAVPSSVGTIHVAPPTTTPATPNAPKPGSARAKMFDELNKRATTPGAPPKPAEPAPTKSNEPAPTTPATPDKTPKPGDTPPAKPGDAPPAVEKPETELTDAEVEKLASEKNKQNPWRLVKELKKKHAAALAEYEATKKLIADPDQRKAEVERLTKYEARNKELEDQIRYVDYSKSQEFKEKYEEPYNRQWESSMSELADVIVTDPDSGEQRKLTTRDMLDLVSAPLAKAREMANAMLGEYADDVMANRKEIRALWDKQHQALLEAKTKGAEREQKMREEAQRNHTQLTKSVTDYWSKHNEAAKIHKVIGELIKPIEGDDQYNEKVTKSFEFVDASMGLNPMAEGLTSEQREEIVRRHVAIRHRAALFGPVQYKLEKANAEIQSLRDELAKYKATVPNLSGSLAPAAPARTGRAIDGVMGDLRKLAK